MMCAMRHPHTSSCGDPVTRGRNIHLGTEPPASDSSGEVAYVAGDPQPRQGNPFKSSRAFPSRASAVLSASTPSDALVLPPFADASAKSS